MGTIQQSTAGSYSNPANKIYIALREAHYRAARARWEAADYFSDFLILSEVKLRAIVFKLQALVKGAEPRGRIIHRAAVLSAGLLAALILLISPIRSLFQLAFYAYNEGTGAPVTISEPPATIPDGTIPLADTAVYENDPVSVPEPALDETALESSTTDNGQNYLYGFDDTFAEYAHLIAAYRAAGNAGGETVPYEALSDISEGTLSDLNTTLTQRVAEPEISRVLNVITPETGSKIITADFNGDAALIDNSGEISDMTGDASQPSPETLESNYIWPAEGTLTSYFGRRSTTIGSRDHKGIDIGGSSGQPIYAADTGEVIFSGWSDSYGNMIRIRHENGSETVYGHCKTLLVRTGSTVQQGQKIASMGGTGVTSGVHLHFELIIDGINIDPLLYLPPQE